MFTGNRAAGTPANGRGGSKNCRSGAPSECDVTSVSKHCVRDVICVVLQAEEQALAAIVQERDEALMMKRKMEEDARRIAEEEERLR